MFRRVYKFPVAFVASLFVVMVFFDKSNLGGVISIPYHKPIALFLLFLGAIVIAMAVISFKHAHTTLNPETPNAATSLIKSGIFSVSRNPIYVGFLLLLTSFAVYSGNSINFIFLPLFVMAVNRLYILPEEAALETIFKEEYIDYKRRVRRWL